MSVAVVHPQVQHAFEVAAALYEASDLNYLYSSLYFKYRPTTKIGSMVSLLNKRSHSMLPASMVKTFPYPEVLRLLARKALPGNMSDRLYYSSVWMFDKAVANKIAFSNANIVIGYENSCRDIFRRSKEAGKLCVLDAASIHYLAQAEFCDPDKTPLYEKVVLRKQEEIDIADKIVTLSSFAKSTYVNAGVPESKIDVITPGVKLIKGVKAVNSDGGKVRFLFVGNVDYHKGVDLLLEAFASMWTGQQSLTIVGSICNEQLFKKKIPEGVRVLGHMTKEKLSLEFQKSDVLVLPSRFDGFGFVVAEAMSYAKPVIVSSHVGAKDLVTHDNNGWIFNSGEVNSLRDTMIKACDSKKRLLSMGDAARKSVSKFSVETYRKNIVHYYQSLLARK